MGIQEWTLDHWLQVLNLIAFPAIGFISWLVSRNEKEADKREAKRIAFETKVETDLDSLRKEIKDNREEALKNFASQKHFDKMEKTMDRLRDRLEDVAIAVGAKRRPDQEH